jgi:ketosteroid isomerase-like protein
MSVAQEHDLPLEEYHRAGREITNGNPEGYKVLYSRRDDVTVANPFGPPVRGWSEVSATLDRAAENYRDGEVVGFENVSTVITPDLAYIVEIESYRARVGGAEELTPVSLRVTTTFRREDGAWKVVHRHADPITAKRPPESVVQTNWTRDREGEINTLRQPEPAGADTKKFPSRRAAEVRSANHELLTIRDGMIVRFREFYDESDALEAGLAE